MSLAYISGCQAVSTAVKLARVDVVAAYPITPQTSIVEGIAKSIADGELQAQMIHVEGEHSAMSACVGAACVGARAFTATSGQGLAFMQEPVFWTSGLRLPIVMAVTNRSLLGPNTIFCDHQDTMSHRDSGWLQLYVENCQETLDSILIAYRVAESQQVQLPIMVCLDGFFLSHLYEPVAIPDQESVDAFLPKQLAENALLDTNDPKLLNVLSPPEYYTEFEYDKHTSINGAEDLLTETFAAFSEKFGRDYANMETDFLEDAEIVLMCMGTMAGTARSVVKELRAQGIPVGLIKVKTFRPFPGEELARLLSGIKAVGVLDRSISFGSSGPLYQEVLTSINTMGLRPHIIDFIVGLGGRDVSYFTMREAVQTLENTLKEDKVEKNLVWLDLREDLVRSWGLET
jgi:pyruvate ferredoxin oxidoreductase alpha subunit